MRHNDVESFFTGPVRLSSQDINGYFVVDVRGGIFSSRNKRLTEMREWCTSIFGDCGSISDSSPLSLGIWPAKNDRWLFGDGKFWFVKELDRTVFLLTWSSNVN